MKQKRIANYRITNELLGSGAFSNVYLAYTKDEQKIAVKVIPRHNIKDNEIDVFESQIKLLNNCKNQHIINCINVRKTQSNFYIFLQYCDNGNLAEYITKNKKLQEKQAILFLYQIIKAMNSMRKMNIVHRDLKPANIMLKGQQNKIKIVDFGLAKKYSKGQMLKTYAGTPLNMAPQILKGQLYNEKAQIYSVGTILYQMLFGISPYIENDKISLIKKIDAKCLKKQKGIKISNFAQQLLNKMLEPNPQKRINLTELLIEMQEWQNGTIQDKITIIKKASACALPYICMIGGLCSFYKFDFNKVKSKSIYDMDLKIYGKLCQKLISNQLQWLSNIDMIRV